jgi:DNA-binding transcriptional MerR regulator
MTNPAVNAPTPEIPDKLYFRIGEVSQLAGVKPFVLRFWETEFPALAPKKSGTGQRLYRRKEVEMVLEIKRLLYEERFTIEGARNFLASKAGAQRAEAKKKKLAAPAPPPLMESQGQLFGFTPAPDIDAIRAELREILALLN